MVLGRPSVEVHTACHATGEPITFTIASNGALATKATALAASTASTAGGAGGAAGAGATAATATTSAASDSVKAVFAFSLPFRAWYSNLVTT